MLLPQDLTISPFFTITYIDKERKADFSEIIFFFRMEDRFPFGWTIKIEIQGGSD